MASAPKPNIGKKVLLKAFVCDRKEGMKRGMKTRQFFFSISNSRFIFAIPTKMSIERADYSLSSEKPSAEKDFGPHVYEGEAVIFPNDGSENVIPREEETHRALSPRQLSMIALGGAIGE